MIICLMLAASWITNYARSSGFTPREIEIALGVGFFLVLGYIAIQYMVARYGDSHQEEIAQETPGA